MKPLTARQRTLLDFIATSTEQRGFAPTIREMGDAMNIASTNGVNDHLRALEKKGFITRNVMLARSVRIVGNPSPRPVLLPDLPPQPRELTIGERLERIEGQLIRLCDALIVRQT